MERIAFALLDLLAPKISLFLVYPSFHLPSHSDLEYQIAKLGKSDVGNSEKRASVLAETDSD